MPGQPLDQTISLTGADAVKAQLADLSATGGASLDKLAQSAASGQAGFDSFGGGVNNLAAILTGLSGNVDEIGEKFSGFADILAAAAPALESFAGAASLAGLYELAASAAEATHAIESLAVASGSTTEEIQGFQYALASVGVSADTGTGALTKMLAFLGTADAAFQKAADSANALSEAQDVAREKADLTVQSSEASANAAQNSYQAAVDGIAKAQVAVDKAQISYYNLQQQVNSSTKTGQAYANLQTQLRDSASNVATATDGIGAAQNRANQALQSAYLAQQRVSLAEKERQAQLDKLNESTDKSISLAQNYAQQWGIAGADVTATTTDGTEAFYKALDGLKGIADAATRADVARAIFGRGWKELIPAIAAGGTALKAADEAFQTFGLDLNESDKDLAGAFNVATHEFSSLITAIKNIAGDQLTQLFTPALQALNKWIEQNGVGIRQAIDDFVNAAKLIQSSFGEVLSETVFPAVTAAVNVMTAAFDLLSKAINALGGNTTGGEVAFFVLLVGLGSKLVPLVTVIGSITGATRLLSGAFGVLSTAIKVLAGAEGLPALADAIVAFTSKAGLVGLIITLLVNLYENWDTYWPNIKAAAQGFWELVQAIYNWFVDTWTQVGELVWQKIVDSFNNVKDYLGSWVDWFNNIISTITTFFSDSWNKSIAFVENLWNELVDWATGIAQKIQAAFQPLLNFFEKLWEIIQDVTGASADAGSASGWTGGEVRAAGGGRIIGPGTGTSDSIPAYLSNGEFVVNQRAAQSVGYDFLHAVNSGAAVFKAMGGMVRGMWGGGFVGAPQRFAGGGVVAAGNPGGGMAAVHLHLGGSTYSLIGEKGVVQALTGAARKAAITQTGRSPSWRK